jgi:hypothetical protein
MDTSHLAEHAGAASSFFASMFVVATLSMRTMIPLRVFGGGGVMLARPRDNGLLI